MKRCPISPVIRQIQIKTTMSYYFTPVRIAIIKSIYKHTGVGCQESGKIEQLNWTETCWRASGQKESSCTIAKSVNWYSLILYWYSILISIFHIKLYWYSLIWKTVWRFLKKLKIELPYDPTVSLLCGILKNDISDPICKAEIETQMYRTNVWIPRANGQWNKLGYWDWHIYTIDTCIKYISNENILYNTGKST